MRFRLAVACFAIFSLGCSDDGGTAGPSGTGGTGGSGGANGGSGGASGGTTGGTAGSCDTPTPSLARIGPTFEIPTLGETAPKRNPDVAHDPVHDVYLVVTGATAVSGTFVDPDGQSLAPPFAVANTTAYTQSPRVTYGGDKLLVAWHDNRDDPAPQLRARLVGWSGSAPDLGSPDFSVSSGVQSYQEMPPALAYSETSQLFLVVWQAIPGDDIRARRVDGAGALVGDEIVITSDADWQSGAAATWNAQSDEFWVTWSHAGAQGAAVHSRRIEAADGSFTSEVIELGTAGGTWTTQAIHLPCDEGFFAGWVQGGGEAVGLVVNASGAPVGTPFPFPAGYGYPDGFAVAHHPSINSLAAVMHGPTDEDVGVALLPAGQMSAPAPLTESPGDQGNFNPRITASSLRNEWLLVTSRGFETVVAQRIGP